jgi:hypothetical protein
MAAAGEVRCDGGKRQGIGSAAARHHHVPRISGRGKGVLHHFACGADDGRQPAGPAPAAAA